MQNFPKEFIKLYKELKKGAKRKHKEIEAFKKSLLKGK